MREIREVLLLETGLSVRQFSICTKVSDGSIRSRQKALHASAPQGWRKALDRLLRSHGGLMVIPPKIRGAHK